MSINGENKPNYKTELEKNSILAFVPGGNSMWPTLKNRGQSVIVQKKTDRLKPLDVALYTRGEIFVLHRVLEVIDGGYIICGDSQFSLERVKEEQVFGVMTGFYRGKKYIDCTDAKYIREVKRWYKRKTWRKIRLKCFFFMQRVKGKLSRIFNKLFKKGNKNV